MVGGIFQILIGVAVIIFGFTVERFYPAFIRKPRPDEKPMAKWWGRTIFFVVGIVFIVSGYLDVIRIHEK